MEIILLSAAINIYTHYQFQRVKLLHFIAFEILIKPKFFYEHHELASFM